MIKVIVIPRAILFSTKKLDLKNPNMAVVQVPPGSVSRIKLPNKKQSTLYALLQKRMKTEIRKRMKNQMKFLFNIIAILTIGTHSQLANSQVLILSTKETLNQSKKYMKY